MKISVPVVSTTVLGLLLATGLFGQATNSATLPLASTPALAPAPASTPAATRAPGSEAITHHGLRYADFVTVNETLTQTALEDPAIVEFSKQVEAMIAKRDEMIMAAACKKHPEIAERIQTMKRNADGLKLRASQQADEIKALKSKQPITPISPKG